MLPTTLDCKVTRGLQPDKWVYVRNGVDLDEWSVRAPLPVDTKVALQAVKANDLFVLGCAGTQGLANALDALPDASSLLIGKVEIVLIGTGPERDHLMRRDSEEKLSNVTMLPFVPKASIPALLDAINIDFIGWHPNPQIVLVSHPIN